MCNQIVFKDNQNKGKNIRTFLTCTSRCVYDKEKEPGAIMGYCILKLSVNSHLTGCKLYEMKYNNLKNRWAMEEREVPIPELKGVQQPKQTLTSGAKKNLKNYLTVEKKYSSKALCLDRLR